MIQKKIKTLTGTLLATIPTQLHELKLGQLIAMQEQAEMSDLDAISILSNISVSELNQVVSYSELQVFNGHIVTLSQEIKHLYNSEVIPSHIKLPVKNETISIPVIKNLSVEPAGAFMAARDIIAEEISAHIAAHGEHDWQASFNPSLKACSQILAQYFYTRATGLPYDEQLAAEFTSIVEQLPVTEALPIAKYFFLNYPNLSRPKTSFWHRLQRLWSKKPASGSSKSFGLSTP
jgi:hypothetical protein